MSLTTKAAALLLASCIPILAQQPAATASLTGSVRLSTGEPATGAIVAIRPADPKPPPAIGVEYVAHDPIPGTTQSATIGLDGAFHLDAIPPGDYNLQTYQPGFLDRAATQRTSAFVLPTQLLHLAPGQRAHLDIALERAATIEGTVRFAHTGQPVPGVAVSVELETAGKFRRFGGAAHTDAQGHYNVASLPTGRYIVFAASIGPMMPTTRGTEAGGGPILFAPATVRATQAQIVAVQQPRTSTGIDITLPTTGVHFVTGKVLTPSGIPITEGLIRLFPANEPDLSRTCPLGPDGSFSFAEVPDETYTLKFETEPQVQFLGVTPDRTGVRMLLNKPLFQTTQQDLHVTGADPAPITLIAKPNP